MILFRDHKREVVDRVGGPDRDRTDDLFHAMEARSQLRHRPTYNSLIVVQRERFVNCRAFQLQDRLESIPFGRYLQK